MAFGAIGSLRRHPAFFPPNPTWNSPPMQNSNQQTDNDTAKNAAVSLRKLSASGRIDQAVQDMADAQMRLDDATSNLRDALQELAALNGLTVTQNDSEAGRDDLDIPDVYPYAQRLLDDSDDPRDHIAGQKLLDLWTVAHKMRREFAPQYIATR